MESAIARKRRHLVRHGAEIEDIDIIGAADHVDVAEFHHDLWGLFAPLLFPEERRQVIPVPSCAALHVRPRPSGPFRSFDGK